MRDKRPFSVYLQLPAIKKQVLETANRFDVDAARRGVDHDESRYTGFLCSFFRPMGDKREIHGTWLNVSLRCTNCSVSRKGGKKYIAVLGSLGRLNLEFHLSSRKDKITKIQSSLQNLLLFRALS